MPALQSYHDSVAIAQRLPPNRGAIHGVIVERLQVNCGAITAKSVGDFFERRRGMPLLEAMSCNYKDRHRNAFYLYVCNDTDMNCELEIAGQMKTAHPASKSLTTGTRLQRRKDVHVLCAIIPSKGISENISQNALQITERSKYYDGCVKLGACARRTRQRSTPRCLQRACEGESCPLQPVHTP